MDYYNNQYIQEGLLNTDVFQLLLRNTNYLNEFYDIKEVIDYSNFTKYFGYTKDKLLSIIVTRQALNDDETFLERIGKMVSLIEENVILVENIWIEQNQSPYLSIYL
jgi:hypothetical protein